MGWPAGSPGPVSARRGSVIAHGVMWRPILALFASALGFVVFFALVKSPISSRNADGGKLIVALVGACLVVVYGLRVRRFRKGEEDPRLRLRAPDATKTFSITWFQNLVLILLCVFGAMNYYRFDLRQLTTVGNYYDTTYYYLNSKYFEELGYQDLYLALLVADEENKNRLSHVTKLRDLETYQLTRRTTAVRVHRARIEACFTPERWNEFLHDSDWFVRRLKRAEATYLFRDHGYNPPPPWTLVGGFLSSHVSVEHLKWITMIDFGLVLSMFAGVFWAVGWEACLLAFLWFVSTASGVWPIVGQALLRFDWLAATVGAACLLKKGRSGWAGGLLAYAALTRVFPGIFFLPYLFIVAREFLKTRTLSREARRFFFAAAAVSTVMIAGAYREYGGEAFVDAKEKLALHGSAASYSSLRMGLGDALIYRGERTRAELRPAGGISGKAEKLADLEPVLRGVGALVLLLTAWFVARTRPRAFEALPLAYFALFALTNPQYNYHNIRVLLMVWHASAPGRRRNMIGMALLFLTEVAALAMTTTGGIAYARTSVSSLGLLLYSLVQLGFVGWTAAAVLANHEMHSRTRPE